MGGSQVEKERWVGSWKLKTRRAGKGKGKRDRAYLVVITYTLHVSVITTSEKDGMKVG